MAAEVSIVVPVYNSSLIIHELVSRVDKAMITAGITYELILVDDCSADSSWKVIADLCKLNPQIKGLRLAKNGGQWCTSLAGMSKATGRYIVTIDDDLEYEPNDIPKLYQAIIAGNYYVVFGMARDKYLLQSKTPELSKLRKRIMHKLWNSPPTDNFRIFTRNLVFEGDKFLPRVFIDAFLVQHIDKVFFGYEEVSFNKRFVGKSNVAFLKRIKLFLLYRLHFALDPVFRFAAFALLFLTTIVLSQYYFFLKVAASLLLFTAVLNYYYLWLLLHKENESPLYLIVEEVNKKPHNCISLQQ